jgi:peptidoglycan/LPS O-acetylase OafA/YrhL
MTPSSAAPLTPTVSAESVPDLEAAPPRPAAASPPARISELDALRGIAAMAVVLHHLTRRFYEDFGTPAGALPTLPFQGIQGVFLFFIISGFVISQTLDRTRRARDFAVSRFSRIYPSFWVCLLLTYGAVTLFGLPGREVGVMDAVVNLTMLQDHVHVPQVDYVYWSLTIELSFYGIAYWVHSRGWLARFPHRVAWSWLLYSAAYAASRRFLGVDWPVNLQLLTLPAFAPLFVAGILFYRLHGGRGTQQTHLAIAACLALHHELHRQYGKTGFILSLAMFLCFYLVSYGRLGLLRARPLLFLGAISYPLYLLHDNLGMVLIRELMETGALYPVALVIALALIVGLSAAVTRWVERPALRWLRSRLKP